MFALPPSLRPSPADGLALGLGSALVLATLCFGGITRPVDTTLHVLAAVLVWVAVAIATNRRQHSSALWPLALAIGVVSLVHLGSAVLQPSPLELASGVPDPTSHAAPWSPTARGALAWLRFALLLGAAWIAGQQRQQRRLLAGAVLFAAAFEVFYGAPRWFAASTEIWGRTVPGDGSRLRGTFVNPDHLALFLAMAMCVAFSAAWAVARNTRFAPLEQRIVSIVGPVLVWLTLFVALAFTGSRAGLAAALVATVGQGFVIGRGRLLPRLAGVAAAGLGLATVGWIGLSQGLGRVLATSAYEVTWSSRLEAARAGLELWRQAPLFGVGIGGFRSTFPSVQPPTLAGSWRHVHNDWLELLIETGVVGVGLLTIGLGASLWALTRRELPERSEDRAALVAALGTILVVSIHEVLDFGLTMPANSWTFAVVLGAGVAAMGGRRRPKPLDEDGDENDE